MKFFPLIDWCQIQKLDRRAPVKKNYIKFLKEFFGGNFDMEESGGATFDNVKRTTFISSVLQIRVL